MTKSNDGAVQEPNQAKTNSNPGPTPSSPSQAPNQPNQTPALGSNALVETIRGIFNSTVAPIQVASTNEFASQGFSFVPLPYAQGHYTMFFRALKEQDHIIMKTLDLSKMKPIYKNQTIDESCKIFEYLGKKEKVSHVVHVYGQFLIGDTLHVFMRNCTERSIHFKMRVVARFKENLIRQWSRQLGTVCKYMKEKGIVHRSIRVEHLLLDDHDNLYLTGFTRAIFVLNPHNFQLNKCNREYRCRKRNHLPPECFFGTKHSPEHIDQWSFGVIIVSLFTNRHPFNPKLQAKSSFEQQWQAFVTKHGAMVNASVVLILNRLFVTQESDRPPLDEILKLEYLSTQVEHKKEGMKKTPKVPGKASATSGASPAATGGKEAATASSTPPSPAPPPQDGKSEKAKKPKFEGVPMKTSEQRKSSKSKPSTVGSKNRKSAKTVRAPSQNKSSKHQSVQGATPQAAPQKANGSQMISLDKSQMPTTTTNTASIKTNATDSLGLVVTEATKSKEPTGSTSQSPESELKNESQATNTTTKQNDTGAPSENAKKTNGSQAKNS